jgi:hypothetical protein
MNKAAETDSIEQHDIPYMSHAVPNHVMRSFLIPSMSTETCSRLTPAAVTRRERLNSSTYRLDQSRTINTTKNESILTHIVAKSFHNRDRTN